MVQLALQFLQTNLVYLVVGGFLLGGLTLTWRRWRLFFPLACIAAASVALLLSLPFVFTFGCAPESECWKRQDDIRRIVVQICGGLLALYGLYLANKRVEATMADLLERQTQERAGRFIRAMELLGSVRDSANNQKEANIEARVGAVRSLTELYDEAPSTFQRINPILNDYVRESLRRTGDLTPGSLDEASPAGWRGIRGRPFRPDIQTSLEHLAKRAVDVRLQLGNTYLDGIDLSGQKIFSAVFERSRLVGADLSAGHFHGCLFVTGDLEGANFDSAILHRTDFRDANLRNVTFRGADLAHARFVGENDDYEARNLTVERILEGKNWDTAHFSSHFSDELRESSKSSAAAGPAI